MSKVTMKWVISLAFVLVFSMAAMAADGFVLVDFIDDANNDGISWIEFPGDQDLDGGGWGFPAEELPDGDFEVAWDEDTVVPFYALMKDDGWPNNIVGEGQDVLVPAGEYSALWLLVVHHHGAGEDEVLVNYSDGSVTAAPYHVGDWCGQPAADEQMVIKPPYRHNADGITTPSCGMWLLPRIELDNSKTVESITLPDDFRFHVFGITFEK